MLIGEESDTKKIREVRVFDLLPTVVLSSRRIRLLLTSQLAAVLVETVSSLLTEVLM